MTIERQPASSGSTTEAGAHDFESAEIELTGYFVVDGVGEEFIKKVASYCPGALLFLPLTPNPTDQCTNHVGLTEFVSKAVDSLSSSFIIVVLTLSSRPFLHHSEPVVLKGHFLTGTLMKIKVFEATLIVHGASGDEQSVLKSTSNCSNNIVLLVSQCFKLKRGLTIFVILRGEQGTNTTLLLTGEAVRYSPYLSRGVSLRIHSTTPTRLAAHAGITSDTDSSVKNYFLIVDSTTQLSVADQSLSEDADRLCSFHGGSSEDGTGPQQCHVSLSVPLLSRRDLLRPRCMSFKDICSSHEFDLRGEVLRVHPDGWLELIHVEVAMPTGAEPRLPTTIPPGDLDYPPNRPFIVNTCSQLATMALDYCALYLPHSYKHLRSSAIAVSIRRGARIAATHLMPIYLWTKLKGFAFTSRSLIGIDCFSPNKALQSMSDDAYSALTMKVPPVLRNSCQLYTAWRAEVAHKLQQATGIRMRDVPSELAAHITYEMLESFATFDGGSLGLRKHVSFATAADQFQLFDPRFINLYVIRNGFDNDWLSNRFPQVWTLRDIALRIRGAITSICDRDRRASIVHSFGAYSLHSHCMDLHQLDHAAPFPHGINALLVGSLQQVHLPRPSALLVDHMVIEVAIKSNSSDDIVRMVVRYSNHQFIASLRSQLLALLSLHVHDRSNCVNSYWPRGTSDSSFVPGAEEFCLCHLSGSVAPVVVVHRAACVLEEGPIVQSYDWHLVAEDGDVRFLFPLQGSSSQSRQRPSNESVALHAIPHVDQSSMVCWTEADPFMNNKPAPALDDQSIGSSAGEDCSSNALELTPSQFPSSDVMTSGPVGIRDLLAMDVDGYRRVQRIPECVAVVVSKQLLQSNQGVHAVSWKDKKRKRDSPAAGQTTGVTLRDVMYPDCVKIYLSAQQGCSLPLGAVVRLLDMALTLPESKKKPYLQLAPDWSSTVEFLGMLPLQIVRELCTTSRSRPDPRSICATSDVSEHMIPVASIRGLLSRKPDRCLWKLRGQVVFVKKLRVSLRCKTCQVRASPLPNRRDCVFSCSRCQSQLLLFPLWEASIAFDDCTGECNLSVEDRSVFAFIRSRFDPTGSWLADVRSMVEEYVHRRGMLEYDAYERSDVSSKSKPYHWLVEEGLERMEASAQHVVTMAAKPVFDVPMTERTRSIVANFDLKTNPEHVNAVDALRSYLELGSCCNNLEVTCIRSFNGSSGYVTTRTRDLKVQSNNEERPYMASCVMRPVEVDSRKLAVDCYAVRELKGNRLIDSIRVMMRPDQK